MGCGEALQGRRIWQRQDPRNRVGVHCIDDVQAVVRCEGRLYSDGGTACSQALRHGGRTWRYDYYVQCIFVWFIRSLGHAVDLGLPPPLKTLYRPANIAIF